MSSTEIAWLAGLFEGEGCLSRIAGTGVRLAIAMTDEDVVRRAHSLTELGQVYARPSTNPKHKPKWVWQVGNWPDVLSLCGLLLPWMGNRRRAKMESVMAEAAADGRYKGLYRPCNTPLGISNAGYMWHMKTGNMPACENCMASYRLYMTRWRVSNRDKIAVYGARYRAKSKSHESSKTAA